jgi:hypothetical protein
MSTRPRGTASRKRTAPARPLRLGIAPPRGREGGGESGPERYAGGSAEREDILKRHLPLVRQVVQRLAVRNRRTSTSTTW